MNGSTPESHNRHDRGESRGGVFFRLARRRIENQIALRGCRRPAVPPQAALGQRRHARQLRRQAAGAHLRLIHQPHLSRQSGLGRSAQQTLSRPGGVPDRLHQGGLPRKRMGSAAEPDRTDQGRPAQIARRAREDGQAHAGRAKDSDRHPPSTTSTTPSATRTTQCRTAPT